MDRFVGNLVISNNWPYRVGRHAIFWLVWWAFQGFIYGFYYYEGKAQEIFYVSYVESLFFTPQHMFLSYAIMYYALPNFMFKGKFWKGFFLVLLFILMAAAFTPFIAFYLIEPFRESVHYLQKPHKSFFSLLGGLRGGLTVSGFAVAIKLLKLWYLKKKENDILEKEKLKAELEVLKGQIHPHFMFNTLNSIYLLALKKSDATPEAILKLSQLMRYILTECNKPVVSLLKEIEILQHYIELEKSRFGDRLDITMNIDGDMQPHQIVPLLLLPFVENSFKHGANEMVEQAWMSLDLRVTGNTLKFKLINGRALDVNNPNSIHIGLQNVSKRLALLYPNAHELRITEDDDTFIVSLTVALDAINLLDT
jgi:sensor histidine kinase YesM